MDGHCLQVPHRLVRLQTLVHLVGLDRVVWSSALWSLGHRDGSPRHVNDALACPFYRLDLPLSLPTLVRVPEIRCGGVADAREAFTLFRDPPIAVLALLAHDPPIHLGRSWVLAHAKTVSTSADKGARWEDDGAYGRGGVAGHGRVYAIGVVARVRGDGGLARVWVEPDGLFLDPGGGGRADESFGAVEDGRGTDPTDSGTGREQGQGIQDHLGWCWMDVDDGGVAFGYGAVVRGAVSKEWDVAPYQGAESSVVDHYQNCFVKRRTF